MRGYVSAMSNYANFKGRASRSEFWQFVLVTWAILAVAYVVLAPGPYRSIWPSVLFGLLALAHALPYFAVLTRRLHDLNAVGWWVLVGLIPGLGFGLLVPALFAGTHGSNQFGADPLIEADLGRSMSAPRTRAEPALASNSQSKPANSEPGKSPIAQLEKLAALKASGAVSEVEFESLKARLLSEGRGS